MTAESAFDGTDGAAVVVGLADSLDVVWATAAAALASAFRWASAASGEFIGNLCASIAALAGGEEVEGVDCAAAKPGKLAGLKPGRTGIPQEVGGGRRRSCLGRGDSLSSFSRSRLMGEPARPCTSC